MSGIATHLITVGATLSGVLLTLAADAYLEIRRARDTRELESLRISSEHTKWLCDERVRAYAGLSLAGEEVLHFIRSVLPGLADPAGTEQVSDAEDRWRDLRTELRKAYNQVALFGGADAQATGLHLWRTARDCTSGGPHVTAETTSSGISTRIRIHLAIRLTGQSEPGPSPLNSERPVTSSAEVPEGPAARLGQRSASMNKGPERLAATGHDPGARLNVGATGI